MAATKRGGGESSDLLLCPDPDSERPGLNTGRLTWGGAGGLLLYPRPSSELDGNMVVLHGYERERGGALSPDQEQVERGFHQRPLYQTWSVACCSSPTTSGRGWWLPSPPLLIHERQLISAIGNHVLTIVRDSTDGRCLDEVHGNTEFKEVSFS